MHSERCTLVVLLCISVKMPGKSLAIPCYGATLIDRMGSFKRLCSTQLHTHTHTTVPVYSTKHKLVCMCVCADAHGGQRELSSVYFYCSILPLSFEIESLHEPEAHCVKHAPEGLSCLSRTDIISTSHCTWL